MQSNLNNVTYTTQQPNSSTVIYDATGKIVQNGQYATSTQPVFTQAGGVPVTYTTTSIPTTTTYQQTSYAPSTLGAPLVGTTLPAGQTSNWTSTQTVLPGQALPVQGLNNNMNGMNLGGHSNISEKDMPKLPNPDLELKKRMLENDRETQLKYADMESDKQKKFEDKAEKQREKAAKWKARGMESMVHRHEKKATANELKAHEHFLAAEQYRAVGKTFEIERKQLDPPADKKDAKGKKSTSDKPGDKPASGKSDDKSKATPSDKTAPAATDKSAPAPSQSGAAPNHAAAPAPATNNTSTQQQQDLPSLIKQADSLAQGLHQQQAGQQPTGVGKQ